MPRLDMGFFCFGEGLDKLGARSAYRTAVMPGSLGRWDGCSQLGGRDRSDWFNQRRLHGEIGDIPPAELEATYYRQPEAITAA